MIVIVKIFFGLLRMFSDGGVSPVLPSSFALDGVSGPLAYQGIKQGTACRDLDRNHAG
jgi:hypothetical protein